MRVVLQPPTHAVRMRTYLPWFQGYTYPTLIVIGFGEHSFFPSVLELTHHLSNIEEVKLKGLPPPAFSWKLVSLASNPEPGTDRLALKWLHIESVPLRSPRPLPIELNKIFEEGFPYNPSGDIDPDYGLLCLLDCPGGVGVWNSAVRTLPVRHRPRHD